MQQTDTSQDSLLIEPLTLRELEVLRLICKLYTCQQIADETWDKWHWSKRTVEGHKVIIKQKFSCATWKDIYSESKQAGII